jgi:uncharacterized protein YjcR
MAGSKESAYYEEARRLYVKENLTVDQIAARLHGEVSTNTLYKWAKKGDWGQERAAALNNPRDIAEWLRQTLNGQMEALQAEAQKNPAAINPGVYDAIYKTVLTIEKLEKSQDLRAAAIMVLDKYGEFLKGLDLAPGELQMHSGRMREFFRSIE